jgi:hypothetical protein
MVREEPATELPAGRSTPVLPHAVTAALAHLRRAENEYERARACDWRRSVLSPGVVLPPLFDAVLRARMECRRLGVPEDCLRFPRIHAAPLQRAPVQMPSLWERRAQ